MTVAVVTSPERIYHGWRVVAVLFLCTFMVFGASLYAFVVFAEPLAREFHWSAGQTGSLISAMWLVAPLALIGAPAVKRIGAWRLVVIGLGLQAVALAAIDVITTFWQLYLLRIVMGFGKIALMTGAPAIVSAWFSRRFATAMALVWAGMSAGGLVLSPIAERLEAALGWKGAALVLAGLMMATLFAARWIASADPAAKGEQPSDEPSPDDAPLRETGSASVEKGWRNLSLPVTALMFWCVICTGVLSIAVITLMPPLVERAGISRAAAAALLGLSAGGSMFGSGSIGWITDRFGVRVGAVIVSLAVVSGLVGLGLLPGAPTIVLATSSALAMGYAYGAGEMLWIALTRQVFGPGLFATAYGGYYLAVQLGYAVGGGLTGWVLDHFERAGVLAYLALLFTSPGVCSLLLRPARRSHEVPVANPQ